MSPILVLQASTHKNRQDMISSIEDAVNASGAWIVDYHMFSNIAIAFNITLTIAHLRPLHLALENIGLHLHHETEDQLQQLESSLDSKSQEEISGTLQVTFVNEDPDLRIEVPAVPG